MIYNRALSAEEILAHYQDQKDNNPPNTPSNPAAGMPSLPVGLWHFDEGSGTTAGDSSEYSNNGAINGASWVDGKVGKALEFDGSDNYVSVPDREELSGGAGKDMTLEGWFKGDDVGTSTFGKCLISKSLDGNYKDYQLMVMNNELRFLFENGGGNGPDFTGGRLSNGVWYHVAVTWDATTRKAILYLDGAAVNSQTTTYDMPDTTSPLYIGKKGYAPEQYFNGAIDEVMIYNRALSAEEILAHYQE